MFGIFKILKEEGNAKLGEVYTVHGKFETPCFMNVGTIGAIKGGVSSYDLKFLKCQVELCNTYHLHLLPGDDVVYRLGGLGKFMGWSGPIVTDSGGFQVFSLAKIRKIEEEGVYFSSHINGKKIFMGPRESIKIQSNLASTIAMAFDECIPCNASFEYSKNSCSRTLRWLKICKETIKELNSKDGTINKNQLLFGINQGLTYLELRREHMKEIVSLNCDGYAIGGLSVGEPKEAMFEVLEEVIPLAPKNKPIYLMGVGTLTDILEAIYRGVDMFDCVMPTRNARHAHVNSWQGVKNLLNLKYRLDNGPIDSECDCFVCKNYSVAYLRHLFKAKETLAGRLCVMHNLYFYNNFLAKIRYSIKNSNFIEFRNKYMPIISRRI